MSIPQEEAARALHDIDAAKQHSATAYYYQRAAPHLFLWGAIWVVAYTVSFVWPRGWLIWPVVCTVGAVASGYLHARSPESAWMGVGGGNGGQRSWRLGWRYAGIWLVLGLFFAALFRLDPPRLGVQVGAIVPLFVALFYALAGLWTTSARLFLLGVVLGLVTVAGYLWLPAYFLLWMAAAGGGALILGGFWFRTI